MFTLFKVQRHNRLLTLAVGTPDYRFRLGDDSRVYMLSLHSLFSSGVHLDCELEGWNSDGFMAACGTARLVDPGTILTGEFEWKIPGEYIGEEHSITKYWKIEKLAGSSDQPYIRLTISDSEDFPDEGPNSIDLRGSESLEISEILNDFSIMLK